MVDASTFGFIEGFVLGNKLVVTLLLLGELLSCDGLPFLSMSIL